MPKSIKLKHSEASQGVLTPAHPGATPGPQKSGAIVIEVTGLPDDASFRDAVQILDSIILPDWLYQVDASQRDKNLYRWSNLSEEQMKHAPKCHRVEI